MTRFKKHILRNDIISIIVFVVSLIAFQFQVGANIPVFVIVASSFCVLVYTVLLLTDYDEDDGKRVASGVAKGFAEGMNTRRDKDS